MGFFSKKTPFSDLDGGSKDRFVKDVAEIYLDSFNRFGRFPPGPESVMAIKLRALRYNYRLTRYECSAVRLVALQVALESRRSR